MPAMGFVDALPLQVRVGYGRTVCSMFSLLFLLLWINLIFFPELSGVEEDYDWKGSDWFHIYIMHPHHIKEIVMVKAVTIQTAIGNAGGYIGLFLGKYF